MLTHHRVDVVFGTKGQKVTKADMDQLHSLGNPNKSKNWVKGVRELFFPEKGGKTKGVKNPDEWYEDTKFKRYVRTR